MKGVYLERDTVLDVLCSRCAGRPYCGVNRCDQWWGLKRQTGVDVIPVSWIERQVDKGKWAELVQRYKEWDGMS